jgi:hypothetical protein
MTAIEVVPATPIGQQEVFAFVDYADDAAPGGLRGAGEVRMLAVYDPPPIDVRGIRLAAQLPLSMAAEKLGLGIVELADLERGKRVPAAGWTPETITALVRAWDFDGSPPALADEVIHAVQAYLSCGEWRTTRQIEDHLRLMYPSIVLSEAALKLMEKEERIEAEIKTHPKPAPLDQRWRKRGVIIDALVKD